MQELQIGGTSVVVEKSASFLRRVRDADFRTEPRRMSMLPVSVDS
jgi:hypothetical protein